MPDSISLMLVEDHPVVIWGLQSLVLHQQDVTIVGVATSAADAIGKATSLQPAVIMLPLRLGGVYSGIELCRALASVSRSQLLLYTSFAADTDEAEALLAGAAALVPKTANAQDLMDVIRAIAAHQVPNNAAAIGRERLDALRQSSGEPLTPREAQILGLVLERRTNPEIARRLHVEVSTVKTHVRSILRKLAIQSRRELFDEDPAQRWV